jgi:hypothetical protein
VQAQFSCDAPGAAKSKDGVEPSVDQELPVEYQRVARLNPEIRSLVHY